MFDAGNSQIISIDDFSSMEESVGAIASFQNEATELVTFLQNQAYAESLANLSKTFLLISNDNKKLYGYFSVSTSAIDRKSFKAPHGTTYPSVPAALIGRLGRDLNAKGQGVGEILLFEALKQIVSISNFIGLKVILTDAKDNKAQAFYESYGFKAIKGQQAGVRPFKLYLLIDVAKHAVANY